MCGRFKVPLSSIYDFSLSKTSIVPVMHKVLKRWIVNWDVIKETRDKKGHVDPGCWRFPVEKVASTSSEFSWCDNHVPVQLSS